MPIGKHAIIHSRTTTCSLLYRKLWLVIKRIGSQLNLNTRLTCAKWQARSHTLTHNYTQLACCLLLVWVMVWCAVDRVSGNMRGISASWIDRDDHILPVRKRQSDRYTRCSFEIIIGGQVCTLLAHLNSVLHHAIAPRSVHYYPFMWERRYQHD